MSQRDHAIGVSDKRRLGRRFFATDAETLAAKLIGMKLVRVLAGGSRLEGIVVETEAYLGVHDLASHAAKGRRTLRNETMYGRPGLAYVYFTYGMHHCVNVVCGAEGEPAAVLVRAMEPIGGVELMTRARGRDVATHELCRGPGNLCRALSIDRDLDGEDLVTSTRLWFERCKGKQAGPVVRSPRIGLGAVGKWRSAPLRWLIDGNPSVSRVPKAVRRPGGGSR